MTRNLLLVYVLFCLSISGCGTRTIYINDGSPVRLAAPIKNARVWVQDGKGVWVRGNVTLQEGWYALPDKK